MSSSHMRVLASDEVARATAELICALQKAFPHAQLIPCEAIEGEAIKFSEQAIFLLPLIYLGTCSPVEQKACLPHEDIGILDISLLYKSGPNIVESAQLQYTWQN